MAQDPLRANCRAIEPLRPGIRKASPKGTIVSAEDTKITSEMRKSTTKKNWAGREETGDKKDPSRENILIDLRQGSLAKRVPRMEYDRSEWVMPLPHTKCPIHTMMLWS